MRFRAWILLSAAVVLPLGGCGGGDTCDGIVFTKVTAIHASVLAYDDQLTAPEHPDYSFAAELPALPEGPLPYDKMVLEVMASEGLAQSGSQPQPFRLNWALVPSAHACSPPGRIDELGSLMITSTADISLEYPAGTDLSSLFYLTYSDGLDPIAFERDSQLFSYTAAQFPLFEPTAPKLLILRLGQAPTSPQTHVFTVRYQFWDGRVVSATTQPVQLSP